MYLYICKTILLAFCVPDLHLKMGLGFHNLKSKFGHVNGSIKTWEAIWEGNKLIGGEPKELYFRAFLFAFIPESFNSCWIKEIGPYQMLP